MSGAFKEVEKTPTLVFGEMPDMKEKAELNIIPEKKEEEMDDDNDDVFISAAPSKPTPRSSPKHKFQPQNKNQKQRTNHKMTTSILSSFFFIFRKTTTTPQTKGTFFLLSDSIHFLLSLFSLY